LTGTGSLSHYMHFSTAANNTTTTIRTASATVRFGSERTYCSFMATDEMEVACHSRSLRLPFAPRAPWQAPARWQYPPSPSSKRYIVTYLLTKYLFFLQLPISRVPITPIHHHSFPISPASLLLYFTNPSFSSFGCGPAFVYPIEHPT
jgi:hypothetical protein